MGSKLDEALSSMGMSFLIIIVSEIGDKTFLIAAVLAMTHSQLLVFSAAMSALFVMTVLSAFMGHLVPNLISKQYTEILSSLLFLFFGTNLFREALRMTGKECQEELEQVTLELDDAVADKNKELEEGLVQQRQPTTLQKIQDSLSRFMNPVWIQGFLMTFVAEWGDRSQIATVALAGAQVSFVMQDFWWVTIGGLLGHALCTCIAVIGGRMVPKVTS
jgi:putative Ca2+/H+ antiporter (TMEM165/GDT1 family)